jgi:hypothetical protein
MELLTVAYRELPGQPLKLVRLPFRHFRKKGSEDDHACEACLAGAYASSVHSISVYLPSIT